MGRVYCFSTLAGELLRFPLSVANPVRLFRQELRATAEDVADEFELLVRVLLKVLVPRLGDGAVELQRPFPGLRR